MSSKHHVELSNPRKSKEQEYTMYACSDCGGTSIMKAGSTGAKCQRKKRCRGAMLPSRKVGKR